MMVDLYTLVLSFIVFLGVLRVGYIAEYPTALETLAGLLTLSLLLSHGMAYLLTPQ